MSLNYPAVAFQARSRISGLKTSVLSHPNACMDAAAVVVAALVAFTVARAAIGTGDYGQWLMVSRYYSGESIPDYRTITAVPPMLPLIVAGLSQIITDPIAVMTTTKIGLVVALFMASYWAGSGIFGDRGAGLLGATATMFVTDRMLEMFAFGGLPQATCLVFLAFAIGSFARGYRADGLAMRYWTIGALAIMLAALSHAGTGSLAILSGSGVAVVAAFANSRLSIRDRLMALAPMSLVLAVLSVYWLLVIIPENHQYLVNSASLNYRGPWAFWRRLSAYDWNVILAIGGGLVVGLSAAYELYLRRLGSFALLAVWAAAVWGFFGLAILTHVGTEYPRFQYPLLQPLALGLGGGLANLARKANRWLSLDALQAKIVTPLAALGLVLLAVGPSTAAAFGREANFYKFPSLGNVIASAQLLDKQLPPDGSVVTTVAVGKWFEGVTGRPALFWMPNRYSFRPVERERSLAADVILRSSFSASDGQFFLRYTGLSNDVPTSPWIGINHLGEYIDLLTVLPSRFEVVSNDGTTTSLSSLQASSMHTSKDDEAAYVEETFAGEPAGDQMVVSQRALFSQESTTLSFTYDVGTDQPIEELRLTLHPLLGQTPTAMIPVPDGMDFEFPEAANVQPRISIRVPSDGTTSVTAGDGGDIEIVSRGSTTLSFDVSFEPNAPAINDTGFFYPAKLVDQYSIDSAILENDDAFPQRMVRLEALGFEPLGLAGDYVVLTRKIPEDNAGQGGTQ
jgi:hypothetical protein